MGAGDSALIGHALRPRHLVQNLDRRLKAVDVDDPIQLRQLLGGQTVLLADQVECFAALNDVNRGFELMREGRSIRSVVVY